MTTAAAPQTPAPADAPNEKPAVFGEAGLTVYRASAVGGCSRALAAARLGFTPLPPSARLRTIFAEGHRHEGHVLEDLGKSGWHIDQAQAAVEVMVTPSVVIRGHVDGVALAPGNTERVVVEVKALGKDTFDKWLRHKWEAFPRYAAQLAVYMEGLGMEGLFAVKNRNSGSLHLTHVPEPPASIPMLKAKVARVEVAARKGDLPACDTTEQWGCPFLYLHEEDEGAQAGQMEVDAGLEARLDRLAEAYDRARERVREAEGVKGEARDRLVAVMRGAGADRFRNDRWSLTHTVRKQRRVDMEALRAFVDVAPFEREVELEVVTVTSREKDK